MSRAELLRSLAACLQPPSPQLGPVVAALELPRTPTAAEHTDLFVFQLHPYASVHLGPEGQLGGVARDRVAGFLRALDVTPPAEPDHLAVLLGAYAQLIDLDDGAGSRARLARLALLHEHLWSWLPGLLRRARELGAAPYVAWADLLQRALDAELAELGPPSVLSAHLREAPSLPDPREGDVPSFLAGLLAPVRSGLVLARADLARAARELELGLRIGERAYMLRALLGQDPGATLRFLAAEAERQRTGMHGADLVTTFWRDRAGTTAALLSELAVAGDDLSDTG